MGNNRAWLNWGLPVVFLLSIMYYFSDIVMWVVFAWILSLLGMPLKRLLGKIKIGRFRLGNTLKASLVILFFYILIGLFFYIFIPIIVQQGRNLAGVNYAVIAQNLERPIAKTEDWLIMNGFMEGELSSYADTTSTDSTMTTTTNNIGTENDTTVLGADSFERDTTNYSSMDTTMRNDSSGIAYLENMKINVGTNKKASSTLTMTTIEIDSVIRAIGDTITKTNISVQLELKLPEQTENKDAFYDPTAVVKPTDTPLEKFQKQVISFFNLGQIPQLFSAIVSWLGHLLVLLTSVTFIAFFFLKDEHLFSRSIKALVPNHYADELDHAFDQTKKLLTRYFVGISIQITSITIYMSILLSLFNIPNAILIAFFAALINVVPYIGPFIGMLFGLLVTVSGIPGPEFYDTVVPQLWTVFGIFVSMQILDGFILQPIIFSNSVMAHPLEIFIIVIVGAKLGGITGMVMAIPIYTVLRVVASVFLNEFKVVQKLTKQFAQKIPPDDKNGTSDGANNVANKDTNDSKS